MVEINTKYIKTEEWLALRSIKCKTRGLYFNTSYLNIKYIFLYIMQAKHKFPGFSEGFFLIINIWINILEIQTWVLFLENCDYMKDHILYKDYLIHNYSLLKISICIMILTHLTQSPIWIKFCISVYT